MMKHKIFYVLSGNTVYKNMNDGREMWAEVHDSLCVSEAYETSSWTQSEKTINLTDIYTVEPLGSGHNPVWSGRDRSFKKCYACYC